MRELVIGFLLVILLAVLAGALLNSTAALVVLVVGLIAVLIFAPGNRRL